MVQSDTQGTREEISALLATQCIISSTTEVRMPDVHVTIPLCSFAFTMSFGITLQAVALIQVFEDIICINILGTSGVFPHDNAGGCKSSRVQQELAIIRGVLQLFPFIASLLCTIPYVLLSQRIGRRPMLILSAISIFAAAAWILIIYYWNSVPLRWIWLSGTFLLLGGGDGVGSSIVHTIISDAVHGSKRAQVFNYIFAADISSAFLGSVLSSLLLKHGLLWFTLVSGQASLFLGAFVVPFFVPETLYTSDNLEEARSGVPPMLNQAIQASSRQITSSKIKSTMTSAFKSPLSLLRLLASNKQALLVLLIIGPQSTAKNLFEIVGFQYSAAKFSSPYSTVNPMLSISSAAQAICSLGILPLAAISIVRVLDCSPWRRDHLIILTLGVLSATGHMIISVAPTLSTVMLGIVLVAFGSCATGQLLGALGEAVQPAQVCLIYSAASMMDMGAQSMIAPLMNLLLVRGMRLGRDWMGLPFAIMAVIMSMTVSASLFINPTRSSQ